MQILIYVLIFAAVSPVTFGQGEEEENTYEFKCPEWNIIKGFENVSLTPRPFIMGSKIGWLDVLGYSPEHVASCPVSCLWVQAPDIEQCLDNLDALIFSNSQPPPLSFRKPPQQVWGFFTLESSGNYPEILDKEYQIPFEVVSTYRLDSDLPITYFPSDPHALLRPVNFTKTGEILYLQKNCIAQRDDLVAELMKYVKIDSMGVCLKNAIYPANVSTLEILSRYRFVIMIENSYADDWVTERIFNAWIAGTVPVYLGAPNVANFAPDLNSYVDFRDFSSLSDLAEYLQSFAGGARQQEYEDFFSWKSRPLLPHMQYLLKTSMYVPPAPVPAGQRPPSWLPFAPSEAGDVTMTKDRNAWGEVQGRDFHRAQRLEHCRLCMKLKEEQDKVIANPTVLGVEIACEASAENIDAATGEIKIQFSVLGFQNLADGNLIIRATSNSREWHTYVVDGYVRPGTVVTYPLAYAREWNLQIVHIKIEAVARNRRIIGICETSIFLPE